MCFPFSTDSKADTWIVLGDEKTQLLLGYQREGKQTFAVCTNMGGSGEEEGKKMTVRGLQMKHQTLQNIVAGVRGRRPGL